MILEHLKKMGINPEDYVAVLGGYEKAMEASEEEFMAYHFFRKLNTNRHGGLVTHLQNQFTISIDLYPKTLTVAYNLAIKWKNVTSDRQPYQKRFVPQEGVSLATDVDDDEWDYIGTTCYYCNKMRHIAQECPKKKKNQADKNAQEIAATTATDDTSTIGTKPTSVNVDGGTGEKTVGAFSTIVEEDDDEFGEFNLATVANREKVFTGRDDPVPESWIMLD